MAQRTPRQARGPRPRVRHRSDERLGAAPRPTDTAAACPARSHCRGRAALGRRRVQKGFPSELREPAGVWKVCVSIPKPEVSGRCISLYILICKFVFIVSILKQGFRPHHVSFV